ncbi:Chromosome partition protein Smc [Carpediemonas membranifera]|uniref:Chromosome partition protein Smc n=1 Tax=Carpediemonas membranifera TaxID=201153 RepID=A0A8J6DZC0_9EUKA|nr:Chromosome partition protein Smc [Carpediemonas membranifera]|eukprot:KAG9393414.1 Chromosome partition protein Smc [Carpediemonas membranifera]
MSESEIKRLEESAEKLVELEKKLSAEAAKKKTMLEKINAAEKERATLQRESEHITKSLDSLHGEIKNCENQSMRLEDVLNDTVKRIEHEERIIGDLEREFNGNREETRFINAEIAKEKEAVAQLRTVADEGGTECAAMALAREELLAELQRADKVIEKLKAEGAGMKLQVDTISAATRMNK